MTRTEILAELRAKLADSVAPYFWSDDRLMLFLALGQTQFCRDTGYFRDSTNYPLVTEAGQASYAIPAEVIEIFSIWNGQAPLRKILRPGLNYPIDSANFSDYVNFNGLASGTPFAWSSGEDTGKLTLTPAPNAVYILNMKVWRAARVPFNRRTGGLYDGEMEIPAEFRLAPVEWAAAEAFGDHDSERQDPVKAADHKANYLVIARQGKRAFRKLHGERATYAPNPAYLV
jgi:hypothetical protein